MPYGEVDVDRLLLGMTMLEDPETGCRRDIWGVSYRYAAFSDRAGYWEPVARPLAGCTDPETGTAYTGSATNWYLAGANRTVKVIYRAGTGRPAPFLPGRFP